jgi:archaemetzincin
MITLVPMGGINTVYLETLVEPLGDLFHQSVKIGNQVGIPQESWNSQRKQYLADVILDYLACIQNSNRCLGIMDEDIFAFGLNYVFGEADANDIKAIISIARLKQEFYGQPEDDKLLRGRILKEAIHELGHTFRLKHCPDQFCVMHFSNSLADTDKKKSKFCPVCGRRIELKQKENIQP